MQSVPVGEQPAERTPKETVNNEQEAAAGAGILSGCMRSEDLCIRSESEKEVPKEYSACGYASVAHLTWRWGRDCRDCESTHFFSFWEGGVSNKALYV